uniref:Uncharacterized protein n=1 Tax=Globisporangium ultimum (strain ATCC 200006 / CBS 805.95 / DAOM BR144) TaxID=431595 RepID=K3WV32_GLOUD
MKVLALATTAVAAFVNLPSAFGWWDNGHMMVGEVATQLMDPKDVQTIHSVLTTWEKDFPNTDSITTAAIWADLVKCKSVSSFCTSSSTPSFTMMDTWHYINLPANVNGDKWKGQEPSVALFADSLEGDSIDFMERTMASFATTKSNWAVNLLLRQFIHIFGDTHNPVHTLGGISPSLNGSDAGANAWRFASPCAFSNLHALWDAAAGEYSLNNWNETMDFTPQLVANATELISWLPSLADPLNFDQYKDLSFSAFSTAMTGTNGVLKLVALDSYSYGNSVVYSGLDLTFNSAQRVPCPSKSYIDWAATVAKFRVAIGGKRLAVVLTQFARQIRTLGLAQ